LIVIDRVGCGLLAGDQAAEQVGASEIASLERAAAAEHLDASEIASLVLAAAAAEHLDA
jgi:hypothetical protein